MGCAELANRLLPQCIKHLKRLNSVANINNDSASQLVEYLDCPYDFFNPMDDDDTLMKAFEITCKEGEKEGFIPMILAANDVTLWECLVANIKNDDEDTLTPEEVVDYRFGVLTPPLQSGKEG